MLERLRSEFIAVISQRSGRYLVSLARTINNVGGGISEPILRSSNKRNHKTIAKGGEKDGGRDSRITVVGIINGNDDFPWIIRRGVGEGGRGAETARNVHAPRKLVSLPGASGACLSTLYRSDAHPRGGESSRILTHTRWSDTCSLPYDNDYIFFENAPGEIILLKKYTAWNFLSILFYLFIPGKNSTGILMIEEWLTNWIIRLYKL